MSDAVDRRLQDNGDALSHKDLLQEYRDLHDTGIPHERVKSELLGFLVWRLACIYTSRLIKCSLARSSTTSAMLAMGMLHVLTNPVVHNRLLEEIGTAEKARFLSKPVRYEEVRQHVP